MSNLSTPFGQSYNSPSIFGQASNANNTSAFGTGSTTPPTSVPFGTTNGIFQASPSFFSSTPTSGTSNASVPGASSPSVNIFGRPSVFGQSTNSTSNLSAFGSQFGGTSTGYFGTNSGSNLSSGATESPVLGGSPAPFGVSSGQPFAFGVRRNGSRKVAYSATKSTDENNRNVQSLSAMPVHKDKSHEELRLEDYNAGDKGDKGNPFGPPISTNPFPPPTSTNPFPAPNFTNPFTPPTSTNMFPPLTSANPFPLLTSNPFPPPTFTNPFPPPSSTNPFPPLSSTNPFPPPTSTNQFPPPSFANPFPPPTSTNPFPAPSFTNPFPPPISTNTFPPSASAKPSPPPASTNLFPPPTFTNPFPSPPSTNPFPLLTSNPFPPPTFTNPFPPPSSTNPFPPLTSTNPFPPLTSTNPFPPPTSTNPFPLPTPTKPFPPSTSSNPFPPPTFSIHLPPPTSTNPFPPLTPTNPFLPSTPTNPFPLPTPMNPFTPPTPTNPVPQVPDLSTSTQRPTSGSTVDQPVVNANPFGKLPEMARLSITQPRSHISVQYGISSMPVHDKPSVPVRLSSSLISRHLSHHRIKLPTRKYDSKSEGPKVPFFNKDEEKPYVRASTLVPRENPRALVIHSAELWPRGSKTEEIYSEIKSLHRNGDGVKSEDDTKKEPDNAININLTVHEPDAQEAKIAKEQTSEIESLMPQLSRSDYYTVPSIKQLAEKEKAEPGFCSRVNDFEIGRCGYGNIKFLGKTDVRNLTLETLVEFNNREVNVYKNEDEKPPVGQGLNKQAEVTLFNINCAYKKTGEKYAEGPKVEKYKEMLTKKCKEQGVEFVSFNPAKGEWKFKVQHF